jgi:hypothetical protein
MHNFSQVDMIFGLSPVWFAGGLFIVTYLLIVSGVLTLLNVLVSRSVSCHLC